jgi:hypothetical protein
MIQMTSEPHQNSVANKPRREGERKRGGRRRGTERKHRSMDSEDSKQKENETHGAQKE